jgi:hypothetical protein
MRASRHHGRELRRREEMHLGRPTASTCSLLGVLCGALVLSPALFAQARLGTSRLVRIFSVGPSSGVILINTSPRGHIVVHAWNRSEIRLMATASLDVRFSNNILTVRTPQRRATGPEAVDIEVNVPADCAVEASSRGGKIVVRGVRGRVKLSTMEGDIELRDIASPNVDAVSITTGRIVFSGILHERGTYTFYSSAGTIEVLLPKKSSFTLDASTHEGRIETEGIHLRSRSQTPSHVQGVSETGGALLKLRTHSGRIQVRHR